MQAGGRWLRVAAATALVAAIAWSWLHRVDSVENIRPAVAVTLSAPGTARPLSQDRPTDGEKPAVPPRTDTEAAHIERDPAGGAADLKRVFDDYIESTDPRQRRTAVRAFEACVPAFLPGTGQMPSPEPLIAALPLQQRAEREVAWRTLFARCHRMLAGGRESFDGVRRTLESDPQSRAPGTRALDALLAGRPDRFEQDVTEALSSHDPGDVGSLAGIAARIGQSRSPDGADAALMQRAREVDIALPLVACDLGLDCTAQSLWSLQLCASEGWCSGNLAARLTARAGPDAVNLDAVQQQRMRLLALIRSARKLNSADLLPS